MILEELVCEYFDWLVNTFGRGTNSNDIFTYLNSRAFVWSIPGDENRALAGRDLRKYFLYEHGLLDDIDNFDYIVDDMWDTYDTCTVLECLIGIAKEWEDELAFDPRFGDRTCHWLWEHIIYNLLSQNGIEDAVDIWMYREYDKDGNGNIFTIPDFEYGDMRDMEIWYQLCAYMNYLESEEFEHVLAERRIR